MKSKNDSRQHIAQAKNLVRGALSILRASSVPDALRDPWKQEQLAQHQINRALAKAKSKLSQRALMEFESWVADAIRGQNRGESLGSNLTSLGLLPNELKPRDIVSELRLATTHLNGHRAKLILFAKDAAILAGAIANKDWGAANDLLQAVRKREGYSYWAIETELALKQSTDGVEALKALVTSISICTFGLNKFFLYYFGVRNEPAQTAVRFKVNLKRKIEDSDLSTEMQAYAKYRLFGNLEATQSNLSAVLAYEQLTTTVDLLFTVVRVTRFIVDQTGAFSEEILNEAKKISEELKPIISELGVSDIETYGETTGMGPPDSNSDSRLLRLAHHAIRKSLKPSEKSRHLDDYEDFIVNGLASKLSTRSDGLLGEELAKNLLNLNWLPISIELGNVDNLPLLPKLFKADEVREFSRGELLSSINVALQLAVKKLVANSEQDTFVELHPVANAIQAFRVGQVSNSIQILNEAIRDYDNNVAHDIQTIMLANYFHENGNTQECLSLCSKAGMENDHLIPLLPLAEMFQGVKWSALRQYVTSIDLAIALDHYLRVIEDRKVRGYKRYAIEELMKAHNNCSVVELAQALVSDGIPSDKIEYLLYSGCDQATVELLPNMADSRKVMLTRVQILRCLALLHTNNELMFLREAIDIENELEVNDGLSALDDSKVFVDEQAILNLVYQEMSADFQRYQNLVNSGICVSDSLVDVLKSFKNPSARTFQIPKNDADDLLAEIISSILEKFLFDAASGLDIIIGRRIRHGTIASELRGYLESVELIGQKPRAGADYDAPMKVVSLCLKLESKRRRFINAAFSRFSQSIDQLISLLRDEYFYVRSKSKTRGIFELQITTVVLALARSMAQTCKTMDQFTKECFEIFWFYLSVHADASRPVVEAEIKKVLSNTFAKLMDELRSQGVSDPEFIACIQQASEELQNRASIIGSWIRVPKASVEGVTYSIQRVVDMAIAMVTGQRPGFHPNITSVVPEGLLLDMHGVSIVVDAMYIALDNICEHSGKKVGNNVKIEIRFDSVASLISFSITNEVGANSRTSEKEARLNATRLDIHRRAYGERARLNRGSGLSKLAAIVMQSDKTTITFGYVDLNLFQLSFDLVYLGLSNSSDQANISADSFLSDLEVGVDD